MKGYFFGCLLLIMNSTAAFASFEKGKAAYEQGDFRTALKEFEPMAKQGDVKSQTYLGYMYEEGQGVDKDYGQAINLYREPAEQGYILAQIKLAGIYHIQQNYFTAVVWYRKAAEQGNALAQFFLGSAYDDGKGVMQDYKQAIYWYRKAAEKGNAWAQYFLGFAYEQGKGVVQDYGQAAVWYRKSAENGDPIARRKLADMYEKGQGVSKNKLLALMLYKLNNQTLYADELAAQLTPDQRAEVQSLVANWKKGMTLPTSTKTYPASAAKKK